MVKTRRNIFGIVLASIGVLVVLAELALHFVSWYLKRDYEMNHMVLLIGAMIGFVGFYIIDPRQTEKGSRILRDLVPRFGRRSTDAVAIPTAETKVLAEPVTEVPLHEQSGQ